MGGDRIKVMVVLYVGMFYKCLYGVLLLIFSRYDRFLRILLLRLKGYRIGNTLMLTYFTNIIRDVILNPNN